MSIRLLLRPDGNSRSRSKPASLVGLLCQIVLARCRADRGRRNRLRRPGGRRVLLVGFRSWVFGSRADHAATGAKGSPAFGKDRGAGRTSHQAAGAADIAISISKQTMKIYDANGLFAETPISTGMRGHSTPMGAFSVIQKQKLHHSNIYSGAPMPYMQRITWSGIAIHAGVLPGYPASQAASACRWPLRSRCMAGPGWVRELSSHPARSLPPVFHTRSSSRGSWYRSRLPLKSRRPMPPPTRPRMPMKPRSWQSCRRSSN